jgi:ornithine decarboxylase
VNKKPFVINMGGGFINKYIDEDIPFLLQWIESLNKDWPDFQFQFMAEPGRLFAEQAFSLATHVVSKRKKKNIFEYTINDSIYHSFSGIKHDGWKLDPVAQQSYKFINHQIVESHEKTVHDSVLFGITCDGCDIVMPHCVLPELEVGDTLVWNNMGAYSTSSSTSFNGIEAATHTLIV